MAQRVVLLVKARPTVKHEGDRMLRYLRNTRSRERRLCKKAWMDKSKAPYVFKLLPDWGFLTLLSNERETPVHLL